MVSHVLLFCCCCLLLFVILFFVFCFLLCVSTLDYRCTRTHILSLSPHLGRVNLLLCTDMASRGLDIMGLSHVFNLDLPESPRTYLHRAGRVERTGLYVPFSHVCCILFVFVFCFFLDDEVVVFLHFVCGQI